MVDKIQAEHELANSISSQNGGLHATTTPAIPVAASTQTAEPVALSQAQKIEPKSEEPKYSWQKLLKMSYTHEKRLRVKESNGHVSK